MVLRVQWDASNDGPSPSQQRPANGGHTLEDIDLSHFVATADCAVPLKCLWNRETVGFRYRAEEMQFQMRLAEASDVSRLISLIEMVCPCKFSGHATSSQAAASAEAGRTPAPPSSPMILRSSQAGKSPVKAAPRPKSSPKSPAKAKGKAKPPAPVSRPVTVSMPPVSSSPHLTTALGEDRSSTYSLRSVTRNDWSFLDRELPPHASAPPALADDDGGPCDSQPELFREMSDEQVAPVREPDASQLPDTLSRPMHEMPIDPSPVTAAAARRIYDLSEDELYDYALKLCREEEHEIKSLCHRLGRIWQDRLGGPEQIYV